MKKIIVLKVFAYVTIQDRQTHESVRDRRNIQDVVICGEVKKCERNTLKEWAKRD